MSFMLNLTKMNKVHLYDQFLCQILPLCVVSIGCYGWYILLILLSHKTLSVVWLLSNNTLSVV